MSYFILKSDSSSLCLRKYLGSGQEIDVVKIVIGNGGEVASFSSKEDPDITDNDELINKIDEAEAKLNMIGRSIEVLLFSFI